MHSFKQSIFEEEKSPLIRRRHAESRLEKEKTSALQNKSIFHDALNKHLPPNLSNIVCAYNLNSICDVATLGILAISNNQDAQARLGHAYLRGINTEKNLTEAIKWLESARRRNPTSAPGLWALGLCYYWGLEGHREDKRKAFTLFEQAANRYHYAPALLYLGRCYYHGHGVLMNQEHSDKLFQEATTHGYILAAYALGQIREYGRHFFINSRELRWYEKIVEQGLALAQQDLEQYYGDREARAGSTAIAMWSGNTTSIGALKWYRKWYRVLARRNPNNSQCVRRKIRMLWIDATLQVLTLLCFATTFITLFAKSCFAESSVARDRAEATAKFCGTACIILTCIASLRKHCFNSNSEPQNPPMPDFL